MSLTVTESESKRRGAAFNVCYGAEVRRVRTAAGIKTDGVPDLGAEQLARIESGEQRATVASLMSLAAAHGMGLNEYMERLAQELKSDPPASEDYPLPRVLIDVSTPADYERLIAIARNSDGPGHVRFPERVPTVRRLG